MIIPIDLIDSIIYWFWLDLQKDNFFLDCTFNILLLFVDKFFWWGGFQDWSL